MTELKNMQINSLTNEYLANTINEKAVEYNNNKTEFEMLIKNCNKSTRVKLLAAFELGKRSTTDSRAKDKVTCSHDLFEIIAGQLRDLEIEQLWIVLTNQAGRVIKKSMISQGGIAGTYVDLQVILKQSILSLASGVFLVHNHPSGNKTPSVLDKAITTKLKGAAALMDIKLLDHIIIAGGDYYSFADSGSL